MVLGQLLTGQLLTGQLLTGQLLTGQLFTGQLLTKEMKKLTVALPYKNSNFVCNEKIKELELAKCNLEVFLCIIYCTILFTL